MIDLDTCKMMQAKLYAKDAQGLQQPGPATFHDQIRPSNHLAPSRGFRGTLCGWIHLPISGMLPPPSPGPEEREWEEGQDIGKIWESFEKAAARWYFTKFHKGRCGRGLWFLLVVLVCPLFDCSPFPTVRVSVRQPSHRRNLDGSHLSGHLAASFAVRP